MSEYLDKVFSPAKLGQLELRNRIIKAATYEGRAPNGIPGEAYLNFHKPIADGGIGLTTLAYCAVEADGRINHNMMYMGEHIRKELTHVIDTLHLTGAKVSGQMGHCGGFSGNKKLQRKRPLGPSFKINSLPLFVSFEIVLIMLVSW